MLILKRYDIVNADHQCIGTVIANSKESASKKIKHRFPNGWAFLHLIENSCCIYVGDIEEVLEQWQMKPKH